MTFRFLDSETNKEIIENENPDSLFSRQYVLANKLFDDLHSDEAGRGSNNIIAFCGDRGSGKSSCMKSFIKQKKQDHSACYFLENIDPSFFDNSHNILELVISQLYSTIVKEGCPNDASDEVKNRFNDNRTKIFIEFDKIIQDLKFLAKAENQEKFYDGLQELDSLSAGLDLKSRISYLFTKCLSFLEKELFVICIDDLDLNIKDAYVMAEHIRKYLINKKCIILIGVKVDQLVDVVKISIKETTKVSESEAYEMAVKYVVKLIPESSRVNMPVLEDYRRDALDYVAGNDTINFHSVQESITYQIFKKTGYLFYNSKGNSSYIVPRNLRSLRQLLHLLFLMPERDPRDMRQGHSNQKIFKKYLFETWTQQLSEENRVIVKSLINDVSYNSFNKRILDVLYSLEGINNNDAQQYYYNITLGDVMSEIMKLERTQTNYQTQLLLFFIKTLCSIQMYESYDEVTENISVELHPSPELVHAGEIYSTDALFTSTNKIQRLVNGRFFSFQRNDVLPFREKEENARDILLINGQILGDELKRIGGTYPNVSDEDKQKFKVLEYFILCTSRYAVVKRKGSDYLKIAATSDPVFISSFNYGTKNLVFDVLSIFFNIINLEMTYNRFNEAFQYGNSNCPSVFEFASSYDWTLLHALTNLQVRNFNDKLHTLLSDSVIRNGEVLAAIVERIRANRYHKYQSTDSNKLLKEFYAAITDTGMKTYPQLNDEPYEISFKFLEQICDVLNNCNTEYFNSIYIRQEEDSNSATSNISINIQEIFTNPTYRQSTILSKLRVLAPQIYSCKSSQEWKTIFPQGQDISREDIINALR